MFLSSEICLHLLKFVTLCQANKPDEIEVELNKLPNVTPWLRPGVQIAYKRVEGDSSSSEDDDDDDEDEDMEVDESPATTSRASKPKEEQVDADPGWTVVTKKRK